MAKEAAKTSPPDLGNYMGIPITGVQGRLGDTNQAIADWLELHPEVNVPGTPVTFAVRTVVGPHTQTPKEGDEGQEMTCSEVFKTTSLCVVDDKVVARHLNKHEAALLAHKTGDAPTLEGQTRETGRPNADEPKAPTLSMVKE